MTLPDEALASGATAERPRTRRIAGRSRRERLGGTSGNEILTSATAAVLTVLLLGEGVTLLQMHGLLTEHMFIGLVLIPPLVLKVGSTGYRFARYYLGTRAYREKGPPYVLLRVLAPVLVLATAGLFATGVWLMLDGHRSDTLLFFHKLSFIVWSVVFGIHFLAYLPRVVRSLRSDWSAARRHSVPGSGWRGMLVAAALGGGVALAIALLSTMEGWDAGHFGGN